VPFLGLVMRPILCGNKIVKRFGVHPAESKCRRMGCGSFVPFCLFFFEAWIAAVEALR
jgi:hypothetical protein